MIKHRIAADLQLALAAKATILNLPENLEGVQLNIERPRQGGFGDYAVNVSPLAKLAKMGPSQIAQHLIDGTALVAWSPQVVNGFINFQVPETVLTESLVALAQTPVLGKNEVFKGFHAILEFVSANPTGPLHVGHGRWVALGDSLARLLTHCDATILREFYINDAGNQIYNIANSIWYRCLESLQTGGKLPEPIEGEPYPFYSADYVMDLAQQFLKTHREQILAWDTDSHQAPEAALEAIGAFAKALVLQQQQDLMAQCRLTFDRYFSELMLHQSGHVIQAIDRLKALGMTYDKDDALWLASIRFGDDQDRVLIKSDGSYTYLTADIAYHEDKLTRDNGFYSHAINIWGADHHGYINRMKAALQALGHQPDQLEIILGQLVNLLIDGERTRMGKRKKMLTLADLVEEVGVDAVRFWMVSKSQDTALDFNVELAASSSDENPVFYVQYAHARCASIFRNAFGPRLDVLSKETLPPLLSESDWDAFSAELSTVAMGTLFTDLENDQAQAALRELILKLDGFEEKIVEAARLRSPHIIVRYTLDLAADFHRFYNVCRVLVANQPQLSLQRLVIIDVLKRTLMQALDLLGVSAPSQM